MRSGILSQGWANDDFKTHYKPEKKELGVGKNPDDYFTIKGQLAFAFSPTSFLYIDPLIPATETCGLRFCLRALLHVWGAEAQIASPFVSVGGGIRKDEPEHSKVKGSLLHFFNYLTSV